MFCNRILIVPFLLQGGATPTTKPAIKKLRGASKGGVPAEVLAAYQERLHDLGADSWLSATTPQRKALVEDLIDAAMPPSPSAGAAP